MKEGALLKVTGEVCKSGTLLARPLAVSAGLLLSLGLSGCSALKVTGPDNGFIETLQGAPFHERFKQTAERTFYVEEMGNGFSSHEKLEPFFLKKADALCHGSVARTLYKFGRRYPDGRLPDIRMEECFTGSFCQGTHARFPLVFGVVECKGGDSAEALPQGGQSLKQ